jgi:hypothetical protein
MCWLSGRLSRWWWRIALGIAEVLCCHVFLFSFQPSTTDIAPGVGDAFEELGVRLSCSRWDLESRGVQGVLLGAVCSKVTRFPAFIADVSVLRGPSAWSLWGESPCSSVNPSGQLVYCCMEARDVIISSLGGDLWSPESLSIETLILGLEGMDNRVPIHCLRICIHCIMD